MLITYDSEADVLYIELRRFPAHDSVDIEQGITILLDKERHAVGVEILHAKEKLGMEQLRSVTLRDLAWDTSAGIGPDYRPNPFGVVPGPGAQPEARP